MREKDVPQDRSFYRGHKRICFAVDECDRYVQSKSAGWSVERLATEQALLHLEAQVEQVRQDVQRGVVSPLAYHIATRQMTPKLFAQHAGVALWRVKRHLHPIRFSKLKPALVERYAESIDLSPEELRSVPSESTKVFFE